MPNEAQSQTVQCCGEGRSVDTAPDPFLLLAILAFGLWLYSRRNLISGVAKVTSGNRLIVGKHKIRIFAMYGLFPGQPWYDRNGVQFDGGSKSKAALAHRIDGKKVKCWYQPKGGSAPGAKICRVYVDGEDVGQWMVESGYAVSDIHPVRRKVYLRYEERARKKNLGIHQGRFEHPWIWYFRTKQRKNERLRIRLSEAEIKKLDDDDSSLDEMLNIGLRILRLASDGGASEVVDGIELLDELISD